MKREARQLAETAHEGQKRKFSGEPYVRHPVRVANTVDVFNRPEKTVAAAYLHDTVEDTSVTLSEISERFGGEVASMVLQFTNNGDQILEVGKTEYMKHKLAGMTDEALLVKLADRLDNTEDLSEIESDFAPRYAEETKEVIDHLELVQTLYGAHKRLVDKIETNIDQVL